MLKVSKSSLEIAVLILLIAQIGMLIFIREIKLESIEDIKDEANQIKQSSSDYCLNKMQTYLGEPNDVQATEERRKILIASYGYGLPQLDEEMD